MKIKTLAIAPYRGLMELVTHLSSELTDFDITVVQGDLAEVLPMLKQYEEAGFEMIISRGGTARLIREHSALPVVEVQVSGYDILRLLTLLKGYQMQIEMIGFPNIIQSVVSVAGLMNFEIPYTVIHHEREVDAALAGAKDKGAKVIVGDTVTIRKAKEHGLQGVLITSGRESVLEAFHNAKHVMRITHQYKLKIKAYENWMDGLKMGFALTDHEGLVEYSNESFHKLLRIPADELRDLQDHSLFESFPYMAGLIQNLEGGGVPSATMRDPEHGISISAHAVHQESEKDLFVLEVAESEHEDHDISIIHPGNFIGSFPQLLVSDKRFQEDVDAAAQRLASFAAVAVYGEEGAGKSLFVGEVYKRLGNEGSLTQIAIQAGTDYAFSRLKDLLGNVKKTDLLNIRGVERFHSATQKKIAEMIRSSEARIIFSFQKNPKLLKNESMLEVKLFELFKPCRIFLPPLRDRLDDLEGYIRSFIVTYNEKYGKQIVGIRKKVLETLRAHPWNGNLLELRNLVEQMVKRTDGEFIEEDMLKLLKQGDGSEAKHGVLTSGGVKPINLNQPLEAIESEIIQIVLDEENMNQSRTARRLGINRSTLWRKIKGFS